MAKANEITEAKIRQAIWMIKAKKTKNIKNIYCIYFDFFT